MTIYSAFLISFWFIFLAYWAVSAISMKRNVNSPWRGLAMRILVAVLIVFIFHAQLTGRDILVSNRYVNPVVGWAGVVLCGAGVAFAIWARRHIGKNWGMPMSVKENPELVTSGPYAYVRHPIYTGVLTAILGATLVSGLGWFVGFFLGAIYFIYSANREEKLMLKTFPDQYPNYMKHTKMIVPFVF